MKQVKEMKCLGAMISSDARMVGAIGSTVLGRKELLKGMKLRVVNAMVIATLIYGCEPWTRQRDEYRQHR